MPVPKAYEKMVVLKQLRMRGDTQKQRLLTPFGWVMCAPKPYL